MRDFFIDILEGAGELCQAGWLEDLAAGLEFKQQKDVVTVVDARVETYLIERIKATFPDHDIIAEETGSQLSGSAFQWIIDPIDGTTSYLHRQPYFSVSIALKKDGESIAGGVYAPDLKQLFYVERGKGATLNGASLSVSHTSELVNAVLATGFACLRSNHKTNNLSYFSRIVPRIRDIRRCGSAALDLAYVAAGKYDGFWELNLNEYDTAAGVLLVTEAGGRVYDFSGGSRYPDQGIIATNARIDRELLELFPAPLAS